MYLVTSIWRGALHIDPMRLFPTLDEARAYGQTLDDMTRIYLLSATESPKLIKLK